MNQFLSGRQQELKVGIVSYTENKTVLDVTGNTNVSGIVTATGGFNLGISSAGTSITSGPVTTLNFIGAGNTFAINGTTVDVSIAGGGGGASVSISTEAPSSPDAGDLWYNNDLGRIFIYYADGSSSQWVDAAPFNIPVEPVSGKNTTSLTATEGQTTFEVEYTVGYIDVYLNGIRLNDSEFIATDGSTITLISAASLNDVLDVVEYTMGKGDTGETGASGPLSPVASTSTNSTYYPLFVSGIGTVDPYVNTTSDYFEFNPSTGTLNTNNLVVSGTAGTSLLVQGNARVVGILTVGSSSIVLDGSNDRITIGTGVTINSSGISLSGASGIITASSFIGDLTGTATGLSGSPNVTVGVITATSAQVGSAVTISASGISVTGIISATSYVGDGSGLTGVGIGANDDVNTTGTITASRFISNVSTGTAPLTVSSTTLVSNLNADLLDGIDSGSFLRSDANDTATGQITLTYGDQALVSQQDGNSAAWRGRILVKNATADKASFLGTYGSIAGVFSHNNALNAWADLYVNTVDGSSGGTVRMPSSVLISGSQVWHAGNDGSGSGLDADLLDGLHASSFLTGSATQSNNIYIRNTSPTIYLRDTDHRSSMIHQNSNLFYVLRGNGNDSTTWATYNGHWPLVINLENNDATFGRNISAVGDINSSSDIKLKINIKTLSNSLEKVLSLRGVEYNRIDLEGQPRHIGVIAQEVEEVVPELVGVSKKFDPENGELLDEHKTVSYGNITALLIEAIKEQQQQINTLKEEIENLKNKR